MIGGNGLASMLVKSMGPKADVGAEDPKAGLKAAAEDIIKAIHAKDADALADAFGSMYDQLESQEAPEPGPEVEPEEEV